MTDNIADRATTAWIGYDGECALCLRWVRRVERPLLRHGFGFVALQSERASALFKLPAANRMAEMRVRLADHRIVGGAEAAMVLARHVWWLWPLWLASHVPGAMPLFRAMYGFVARNRQCNNRGCTMTYRTRWLEWLPVFLLPVATLPFRDRLPNWVFMWLFFTAMFAGCKWLTWRRAKLGASPARTLGYLLAWPGMDAKFFLAGRHEQKPRRMEWALAVVRLLFGVVLLWMAAGNILTTQAVVNAWIGMLGLTLLFHFGSFHLIALFWQRAGVAAKPLMQSPGTATSLADFWGTRWNTAFNKLVHDLAFRPLARRFGVTSATLSVFVISGIVHELAISFPARGGYGLPFAYFLLQGIGLLLERSRIGRALGLGRGLRGWVFMLLFTAAPVYWLFHPTFVQNVILPMLQAIGAN